MRIARRTCIPTATGAHAPLTDKTAGSRTACAMSRSIGCDRTLGGVEPEGRPGGIAMSISGVEQDAGYRLREACEVVRATLDRLGTHGR